MRNAARTPKQRLVAPLWLLFVVATSSCHESADCVPGEKRECGCGCGYMGEQVCSADGTEWAECVCDYGGDECQMAGDACPGGKCYEVVEGQLSCRRSCDNPGGTCAAGSGEACYLDDVPGSGEFHCFPPGVKVPGEECEAINACVAGALCVDFGLGSTCWKVCRTSAECETGSTCENTGMGFSACVSEGSATVLPTAKTRPPVSRLRGMICAY
jgi:hypothetical protein